MKRALVVLLLLVLVIPATVLAKQGPVVDTVYFDATMKEEIGLQDTAAGKTDLFLEGVSASTLQGLDQSVLDALELYSIPSGSWSLLFNPVPNKAPYTWEVDGNTYFNPFAIREVRFAFHWLINRQYIVDEILGGAGGPLFTPATPGQPGTYKYNLIATKLGFTPEGDEERALAEIEAAMVKASELPENKGKLIKKDGWWAYNGEPITIKFLIRVDDPNGRLLEGEYVANQIEKAGIKVDRLKWERSKCTKTVYLGDPGDYAWHLYTEGWGAGATRSKWDHVIGQNYAPWRTYMPGGKVDGKWKYTNDTINELSKKVTTGKNMTAEEYWDDILYVTELALKESVRISVVYQNQFFAANKERFNERFVYGLGDGVNQWSIRTANTKDGILKVTQFSSQGNLFMGSWDPVGVQGFSSTYINRVAQLLFDRSYIESPANADRIPNRMKHLDYGTKAHLDSNGEVVGDLEVPTNAMEWDSVNEEWTEVGPGITAQSYGVYEMVVGNFHHGIPMSIADIMYADAFIEEWTREDFEGDPYYDQNYDTYLTPYQSGKGTIYDLKNQKVYTYMDFMWAADPTRVSGSLAPSLSVSASSTGITVSWEIIEAMARMVVEGSKWSFSPNVPGRDEVDLLQQKCVQDIKVELEKMREEAYVPKALRGIVPIRDAIERYNAAIKFIDQYGHAFIGNGPFYLVKYAPESNFMELKAFRDGYPYDSNYWVEFYQTPRLSVDNFEAPVMSAVGEDIELTINVSYLVYPQDEPAPATDGDINVTVITDNGELEFSATYVSSGVWEAKIPGDKIKDLEPGTYTIMVSAVLEGSIPSMATQMVIIY